MTGQSTNKRFDAAIRRDHRRLPLKILMLVAFVSAVLTLRTLNSVASGDLVESLAVCSLSPESLDSISLQDPAAADTLIRLLASLENPDIHQRILEKLSALGEQELTKALIKHFDPKRMASPEHRAELYRLLTEKLRAPQALLPQLQRRANTADHYEIIQLANVTRSYCLGRSERPLPQWDPNCPLLLAFRSALEGSFQNKGRDAKFLLSVLQLMNDKSQESTSLAFDFLEAFPRSYKSTLEFIKHAGPEAEFLCQKIIAYYRKSTNVGVRRASLQTILALTKDPQKQLIFCFEAISSGNSYLSNPAVRRIYKIHDTQPLLIADAFESQRTQLGDSFIEDFRSTNFESVMYENFHISFDD